MTVFLPSMAGVAVGFLAHQKKKFLKNNQRSK
jgi:hypothetical protein